MPTELLKIDRDFHLYGPIETESHPRIQSLCRAPYPGHPHGCPNINSRCKNLATFTQLHKSDTYIGVLWVDFKDLLKLRSSLHTDWSDAQLRNPIQWQGHFRVNLRENMEREMACHSGTVIENTPEGRGVNVFRDILRLGIPIEGRPQKNLYLVSYLCYPKD